MRYTVLFTGYAEKRLKKLPENVRQKILAAILSLADNPRPYGYKKLTGRDAYRIRVGDYRIIYEIEDKIVTVTIIDVGHRREIYD